MIQFLLSATLSRVRCVFMEGDSYFGVTSGFENFTMVVGGCDRGRKRECIMAAIQKEDVHAEIRVIVLTMVETIIHLISVGISLVNLSGTN